MLSVLYVTCPDVDEARKLSQLLVQEDLAACTNVFPIASVYHWEGELVEEDEVTVLVKTRPDLVEAATERILQVHPYDTPCVIDMGVAAVNDAYGRWVDEETKGTGEPDPGKV